jgi:hypothetical protein
MTAQQEPRPPTRYREPPELLPELFDPVPLEVEPVEPSLDPIDAPPVLPLRLPAVPAPLVS